MKAGRGYVINVGRGYVINWVGIEMLGQLNTSARVGEIVGQVRCVGMSGGKVAQVGQESRLGRKLVWFGTVWSKF